jgi:hypothetical protein
MTATITNTPASISGEEDSAVFYDGASPLDRLPPVREYIDTFSISTAFTSSVANTVYTVVGVSFSPSLEGITVSFSGNAINIVGTVVNVFNSKYYQFKMPDGSIEILQPNTTENFYGVIKYQPDFLRYTEIAYTVTLLPIVLGIPDIPEIMIVKQTVNNDWESNRLLLKQLVAQGNH